MLPPFLTAVFAPPIVIGDALAVDALPFAKVALACMAVTLFCLAIFSVFCWASNKKKMPVRRMWVSSLLHLAFVATVVVLAVTSLQAVFSGNAMAEYPLMAHVATAGAFTFLLLGMAWLYLPHLGLDGEYQRENRWWFSRFSSWLVVTAGLVTAGTMFLSMLPILDTPNLAQALTWHRYAGLATVVGCILHLAAVLMTRFGWR